MSSETRDAQCEKPHWFSRLRGVKWTPQIVAIVGPDGSGKTTQARLLTGRLQATDHDARYVHGLYYLSDVIPYADWLREKAGPRRLQTEKRGGGNSLDRRLRGVFRLFGYLFALLTILFVTVRSRNQIVVFDRFYYQFFYDIYGLESVALLRALPTPWRIVFLDAELDEIRPRLSAMDRSVDDSYYETVIDHHAACATEDWLRYRAELPISTLHEQIFEDIYQDIDAR